MSFHLQEAIYLTILILQNEISQGLFVLQKHSIKAYVLQPSPSPRQKDPLNLYSVALTNSKPT